VKIDPVGVGGVPENVVSVGVMMGPVEVGGVPANVGVTSVSDGVSYPDDELLVEVTFIIDEETVTAEGVGGGGGTSLPHDTAKTADTITVRATAGRPLPVATLRENAQIDTTAPPTCRYRLSDIPTRRRQFW
jgi:hypothetical protein